MKREKPIKIDFSEIKKIKKMFDNPNIKDNSTFIKQREKIDGMNQ